MLIHCSNRRQTHAGQLAMGAGDRVRTVRVGSERAVFLFWVFALDFEHNSLVSLLGYGQLTFLQWPCFAFRFPASGRHGLMMTRSQQCLFVFWQRAIYH